MLRAFLCSAALLGLASIGLAADTKDTKDVKNAKNDNGMMATVQKVDAKNHTITVMMRDQNGKEEEKTLNLTRDVKVVDENGKTADADTLKDGDNVRVVERDGKLAEVQREPAASKNGEEATITNVDAKKGTITLKMKDKNGKEQERTFNLTEDARYFDSTGRVAALDVFRSGNEVLVVEEQGKLKEVQQKGNEKKPEEKNKYAPYLPRSRAGRRRARDHLLSPTGMVVMTRDAERIRSVQDFLREASLDAVVCTLPVNVLLLTGYWPVVGKSLATAVRGGRTVLLVPEDERELAERGWADEVRTFEPASLHDLRTPEEAARKPFTDLAWSLGIARGAVGYEPGGASEPTPYAAMHLYGTLILNLLREAFPAARLVPAGDGLTRLRSVKTPREVDGVRAACGIVESAFREGAARLRSGLRETEAAVGFHGPLCTGGADLPGPGRVGGFTFCMSGPNSAKACGAFAHSSNRRLGVNELILVHCNSYADGYWTDVTRTYCLGEPDGRMRRMYDAVFAARHAALDAIRPGAKASAVDAAARSILRDRGFGEAFKHSTGHGVGFEAISPNARPRLHPKSDDVLQTGMVFNVEPAVYFDGFGGLRHCDMVVLTASGAEVLTPFQAGAAQLAPAPA